MTEHVRTDAPCEPDCSCCALIDAEQRVIEAAEAWRKAWGTPTQRDAEASLSTAVRALRETEGGE